MTKDRDPKLSLLSTDDLWLDGCKVPINTRFEVGETTSTALVLEGRATLATNQLEPPFDLLKTATARLEEDWRFGPQCNDAEFIEQFEEVCVAGGRMRPTAKGEKLRWITQRNLRREVEELFGWAGCSLPSIFVQLKQICAARIESSPGRLSQGVLSDAEMKASGLVRIPRPSADEVESGFFSFDEARARNMQWYCKIGADWVEFHQGVLAAMKRAESLVSVALGQGRVLAVRQKSYGGEVVAPWSWNCQRIRTSKSEPLSFLLSKDIPAKLFEGHKSQRFNEKRAYQYLLRAEELVSGRGKQLLKGQAVELLRDGFGLTESAAGKVWARFRREINGHTTNPTREKRITSNEFKVLKLLIQEF